MQRAADAGNVALSAEKNLAVLRRVLAETPGATLAFVGDGPERAMLEEHLRGLPVTFMVRRVQGVGLQCIGSRGSGCMMRIDTNVASHLPSNTFHSLCCNLHGLQDQPVALTAWHVC